MKISKRILNILFVAALILALLPVGSGFAEGTPLVTDGYDPEATMVAGVHFRNFSSGGGREAYLGDPDYFVNDPDGMRTEIDFTWNKSPNYNSFILSYNPGTGLIFEINGVRWDPIQVDNLELLNYIKIEVTRKPGNSTSMNLSSLVVNDIPISPSDSPVFTASGTHLWSITGMDLSAGFTVKGKIYISGNRPPSGETFVVEIGVGYTDVPEFYNVNVTNPAYWHADAALTAKVGTSTVLEDPDFQVNISSAKYNLNYNLDESGLLDWVDMNADDRDFDEPSEDINAVFPANKLGDNTVCVQAWDSLNTASDVLCQDFDVDYNFYGFFDPLAFDDIMVNEVKAGQTVPIKWRLTDGLYVPISDPNSVVGIYSYKITCEEFQGEIVVDLDLGDVQFSTNASGLLYLEDGNWQFNWKTSKLYSDTCRVFFVQFDSGRAVPAQFHFK